MVVHFIPNDESLDFEVALLAEKGANIQAQDNVRENSKVIRI
jgi:hypothetical protein